MESKYGKIPPSHQVDHINQNKLDNRMWNLRVVPQRVNIINRGKQSNNTTGYKGVVYFKRIDRYIAICGKDGKNNRYVGSFKTKEQAAVAYNAAAKKYFGRYAILNKIK